MTSLRRGARLGLALLGAGTMFSAAPASAQTATAGAFSESPQAALSRNLRSLAANPKSATALMGAGRAALDLGDPQAALTFFARAEEQTPRDGRVKMWIGSALIQLQQPHAALKFFRDATDLGVPELDLARDRGLAYDIAGKPRDAQRDYRMVLQRGRDAEVTRRLALSLAISGEREPALRLLEEQLLVRDRAAERSRAMILALTGDTQGAARAASAAMPGPQAQAMTPFLARLPTLSPADRALAVHLGIFPGDGRTPSPSAYAANDFANAVTDAGRPDPAQSALARRIVPPEPVSTAPRRRPGAGESAVAPPVRLTPGQGSNRVAVTRQPEKRPATRPGSGGGNPAWAWSRGLEPVQVRRREEPKAKADKPAALPPESRAEPKPEPEAPRETQVAQAAPPVTVPRPDPLPSPPPQRPAETMPEPAPVPVETAAAEPSAPPPQSETAPGGSRLADLSAAIASIDERKAEPVRATPARPKAAPRAAAPAPKKAKPAPAEPARIWVQVAGGADKAALPREYARLKAKAPKLLGARSAWTTPLNATNRLLVGPFASSKEAQAFVNQLKTEQMSGFAWTSAAGQKVEKLPAK